MTRFPRSAREAVQLKAADIGMVTPAEFERREPPVLRAAPWKDEADARTRTIVRRVIMGAALAAFALMHWQTIIQVIASHG